MTVFEFAIVALVLLIVVSFLTATVKIIDQFQRGVVLTLGKFSSTREPGLTLLIPYIQTMRRADVRVTVMEVKPQDVITSDNVSVKVSAVAYYRIIDASKALLDVEDYRNAIAQLAQILLRSTIGKHPLDELLSQQDKLNQTLSLALEERTRTWGVRIDHVEIRSVDLDASMIRAMAQEAEAERGRRARVITAQGEFEAAQKLGEAADILSRNPAALTLRTLATLKEIGSEQNTTIIFPVAQDTMMAPSISAVAMAESIARTPRPDPTRADGRGLGSAPGPQPADAVG
jgi:regulator of protease activity HflC (stomatin/prohibitin superfamily)